MSYSIKPANGLAQLGAGLGKGLSESIPEEVKRYRLSSGLKKLSETKDLNPEQYLAQAFSIPGMTPSMAEQFGQLARLRARGLGAEQGLRTDQNIEKNNEIAEKGYSTNTKQLSTDENKAPSISKRRPLEEKLNPTLPMTTEEKIAEANRLLKYNPGLVNNSLDKALELVENENQSNLQRSQALQNVHSVQQGVQDRIKQDFEQVTKKNNVELPANVLQKYENEAIRLVLPKEEGGEGLTEQEAVQKLRPQLDSVSRDYKNIESLWGQDPKGVVSSIKSHQKEFKKRNDLENFADTLKSSLGISNPLAYSKAYPIKEDSTYPILKEVSKIPWYKFSNLNKKTNEIEKLNKKIFENMDKNSSPLSIVQYLSDKNIDPRDFLDYLNENADKLTAEQKRQIGKGLPLISTPADVWLQWGGN